MHINNALHEELASDPTGANFATIENSKNPTFPDNRKHPTPILAV